MFVFFQLFLTLDYQGFIWVITDSALEGRSSIGRHYVLILELIIGLSNIYDLRNLYFYSFLLFAQSTLSDAD